MPFDASRSDGQYLAAPGRYETMPYRRVGASGLRLPAISLGLWQNLSVPVRYPAHSLFDFGSNHMQ